MANYFPRWTNILPLKIATCIGTLAIGVVAAFTYYATPKAQRVGYMPDQPIPYDHELHVTQLGLDCRHCHSFVEKSGQANVPTANTCANCHVKGGIKSDSPRLAPLMAAIDSGEPIKWVRVHKSPDYVFFDHSAHLGRGVSCVECHGQVDEMIKKNPATKEQVAAYVAEQDLDLNIAKPDDAQRAMGLMLKNQWKVQPKESCFTCHR